MDNLQTGGIVAALIAVLKGKDFWMLIKQLTKQKESSSKASKEVEHNLQKEIRELYDKKIEMHTDQIESMRKRMVRLEDEREEYKERMIKAETKVDALSDRLKNYIHHSRGKKENKPEED